jgi:hypothetical protein
VASKTVVELFDDLDGGRADETVSFALDGVDYEIDLSTANAAALRDVLAEFIGHAHRVPARARRASKQPDAVKEPVKEPVKVKAPGVRTGKPASSAGASMTAEIRRLASESARRVSEANRTTVDVENVVEVEPDLFAMTTPAIAAPNRAVPDSNGGQDGGPAQEASAQEGQDEVGPVRALIIPFQEAGL